MSYDERHGGPYDRGGADAYYGRDRNPHYLKGHGYQVSLPDMTMDEIQAYHAGYANCHERKDHGYYPEYEESDDE